MVQLPRLDPMTKHTLQRTVVAGTLAIGSLLAIAVAPTASEAATPAATKAAATTPAATTIDTAQEAGQSAAVNTAAATGWTLTSVKPGYSKKALACIRLWKPYGQKISGKWHVVAGGRLSNCGATYFKVTLEQKRWWGWDGRSSKTITRKGQVNPKVKCKTFGKYTWRTTGAWYRNLPNGKIEMLAEVITKTWRTRC